MKRLLNHKTQKEKRGFPAVLILLSVALPMTPANFSRAGFTSCAKANASSAQYTLPLLQVSGKRDFSLIENPGNFID